MNPSVSPTGSPVSSPIHRETGSGTPSRGPNVRASHRPLPAGLEETPHGNLNPMNPMGELQEEKEPSDTNVGESGNEGNDRPSSGLSGSTSSSDPLYTAIPHLSGRALPRLELPRQGQPSRIVSEDDEIVTAETPSSPHELIGVRIDQAELPPLLQPFQQPENLPLQQLQQAEGIEAGSLSKSSSSSTEPAEDAPLQQFQQAEGIEAGSLSKSLGEPSSSTRPTPTALKEKKEIPQLPGLPFVRPGGKGGGSGVPPGGSGGVDIPPGGSGVPPGGSGVPPGGSGGGYIPPGGSGGEQPPSGNPVGPPSGKPAETLQPTGGSVSPGGNGGPGGSGGPGGPSGIHGPSGTHGPVQPFTPQGQAPAPGEIYDIAPTLPSGAPAELGGGQGTQNVQGGQGGQQQNVEGGQQQNVQGAEEAAAAAAAADNGQGIGTQQRVQTPRHEPPGPVGTAAEPRIKNWEIKASIPIRFYNHHNDKHNRAVWDVAVGFSKKENQPPRLMLEFSTEGYVGVNGKCPRAGILDGLGRHFRLTANVNNHSITYEKGETAQQPYSNLSWKYVFTTHRVSNIVETNAFVGAGLYTGSSKKDTYINLGGQFSVDPTTGFILGFKWNGGGQFQLGFPHKKVSYNSDSGGFVVSESDSLSEIKSTINEINSNAKKNHAVLFEEVKNLRKEVFKTNSETNNAITTFKTTTKQLQKTTQAVESATLEVSKAKIVVEGVSSEISSTKENLENTMLLVDNAMRLLNLSLFELKKIKEKTNHLLEKDISDQLREILVKIQCTVNEQENKIKGLENSIGEKFTAIGTNLDGLTDNVKNVENLQNIVISVNTNKLGEINKTLSKVNDLVFNSKQTQTEDTFLILHELYKLPSKIRSGIECCVFEPVSYEKDTEPNPSLNPTEGQDWFGKFNNVAKFVAGPIFVQFVGTPVVLGFAAVTLHILLSYFMITSTNPTVRASCRLLRRYFSFSFPFAFVLLFSSVCISSSFIAVTGKNPQSFGFLSGFYDNSNLGTLKSSLSFPTWVYFNLEQETLNQTGLAILFILNMFGYIAFIWAGGSLAMKCISQPLFTLQFILFYGFYHFSYSWYRNIFWKNTDLSVRLAIKDQEDAFNRAVLNQTQGVIASTKESLFFVYGGTQRLCEIEISDVAGWNPFD